MSTQTDLLKQHATTIKNEVADGANTATRVGGAILEAAQILETHDASIASQQTAIGQKATQAALDAEIARAQAAEQANTDNITALGSKVDVLDAKINKKTVLQPYEDLSTKYIHRTGYIAGGGTPDFGVMYFNIANFQNSIISIKGTATAETGIGKNWVLQKDGLAVAVSETTLSTSIDEQIDLSNYVADTLIVGYYRKVNYEISSVEDTISELTKMFEKNIVNLLPKVSTDVNGFVKVDGSINTGFSDWKHDVISITEIKTNAVYTLYTSFDTGDVPSCVFFDASDNVKGYVATYSGEQQITIPEGTVKALINKHPSTVETYIKETYTFFDKANVPDKLEELDKDVDDLKIKVDALESGKGLPTILFTRTDSSFFVRSSLNESQDVVVCYNKNTNDFKAPATAFIGSKSETTATIVSRANFHYAVDSAAPIQTSNYWFIAGHHGYAIPQISVSGHDKTTADIGSWWTSDNGKEFKLVNISSTNLIFQPKVVVGVDGIGVSDWVYGQSMGNTLSHKSGATHTSSIAIPSSVTTYQVRPACFNIKERFFADNVEIRDNVADFPCKELIFKVDYDVKNPASAIRLFPTFDDTDAWFRINQTYRFIGLSCSVNQLFKVYRTPIPTVYYGATQPLGLTAYGDYHSYTVIPKVKSKTANGKTTDWKYPQDTTASGQTWATTGFYKNSADLEDVNNIPERFLQYYAKGNERLVGFASGLSLISSNTKSSIRNENIGSANRVLHFANDGRNKLYFRVIEQNGRILPENFTANYNYYQCYFDPSSGDALTYYYKDGNDWVVYIHSFNKQDSARIALPPFMEGLTADLVEKTDNAEMLTDTVIGGEIFVKFTDSTAGYIVMRFRS